MKEIAPDVYASTEYSGVNVGFIVTPAGAIAVDAPTMPRDARAWRQRIVDVAGGPVLYVVLTDTYPDRLLSAGLLEAPLIAAQAACDRASAYTEGFWRSVVEGWGRRYPEMAGDLVGVSIVLPEITFSSSLTLHKGGMDVTVECVAGAAPGSAWVHMPDRDVLFTGDVLVAETHPFMAVSPDTRAWLNTLTALRRARFAKTTMVPGRGPLCDQTATGPLSEYIVLARRRVRSLYTPEQTRPDMTPLVAEMLPLFPVPDDADAVGRGVERDLVTRRIKAGLDRLYEELGRIE
jgi:glyoxylase-like metal-dependent hydrolase (beta-lactamase superfamily II)